MFLLYYWPIIAIKLFGISFFKSGILLQQPIAPLEGVSAHPQGNERTGDIRSFWADVTPSAGPIFLRLSRATKWRCFGAIFEISPGHRRSRIYPNKKKIFVEVFQITSRFALARKNLGLGALEGKRYLSQMPKNHSKIKIWVSSEVIIICI